MRDDQLSRLLRQVDEAAYPDAAFADSLFEQLSRQAGGSRRGRAALLLVAAVLLTAVLVLGAAVAGRFVTLPWLAVDISPAPTMQPIASQEATPSAAPTASPTAEPSVASTPSTAGIVIDGLVKSTVNSLRVRAKPTTAGVVLGTIDKGQLGFVVAGPVSADGYPWYHLSGVGLPPNAGCEPPVETNPFTCPSWLGWVAAGDTGGQPWLEATTLTCPASPMNLERLVEPGSRGPTTALERLVCYRSTPIQFRAWWPEIPPDAGLGGACGDPGRPENPTWLICQGINYNGLVISEDAGFEGIGLKITLDPASAVTMPPRGQWVEVSAHVDDPAARDCTPWEGRDQDPVSLVLSCRTELVADSVNPVAGPY